MKQFTVYLFGMRVATVKADNAIEARNKFARTRRIMDEKLNYYEVR